MFCKEDSPKSHYHGWSFPWPSRCHFSSLQRDLSSLSAIKMFLHLSTEKLLNCYPEQIYIEITNDTLQTTRRITAEPPSRSTLGLYCLWSRVGSSGREKGEKKWFGVGDQPRIANSHSYLCILPPEHLITMCFIPPNTNSQGWKEDSGLRVSWLAQGVLEFPLHTSPPG